MSDSPEMPPLPAVSSGLESSLSCVSGAGTFALLIRHADRAAIPSGDFGTESTLTETGILRARAFGGHPFFSAHPIRFCESSPLARCMQTAAHVGITAVPSALLGDPGVFVRDPARAGDAFLSLGTERVVRAHIAGSRLPGFRSLESGTRTLLSHILDLLGTRWGAGLFITHDSVVMPVIAAVTGERFEDDWLAPLDGVVIALDRGRSSLFWRGIERRVDLGTCAGSFVQRRR